MGQDQINNTSKHGNSASELEESPRGMFATDFGALAAGLEPFSIASDTERRESGNAPNQIADINQSPQILNI